MVRVPGRLAKSSLRLSPQPFCGGRIARSLVRRETERRAEPRCSQAVAYRPGNQVARGGDGEESGGGVMGGKLLIQIQREREASMFSSASPGDSHSAHWG